MSTDITIEPTPVARYGFDNFVRADLPVVARAITVVAQDPAMASAAITTGLHSVYRSWSDELGPDQAQRHVFGVAVAHCGSAGPIGDTDITDTDITDAETSSTVLRRACGIARHCFAWSESAIVTTLDIEHEEVIRYLAAATSDVFPASVADEMRRAVTTALAADFDIDAITHSEASDRRAHIVRIAVGALAALLLLGALAQLVARPDRSEPAAEPEPAAQLPTPAPAVSTAPEETPPSPLIVKPTLIATDGVGGFVGVRPPAAPDTTAVFSRSPDGQEWQATGTWDVGSPVTFTRFERSGQHFAVWIDESDRPGITPVTMLGVSGDLTDWRVLDLAIDDEQPVGLIYQSYISELAMSGDNVLALVRTNVEIDFAALSTSESYTCGHSITDDAVTVNLCNSQLDVLSLSQVERLPARDRLFVSRDGTAFERTSEPFSRETTARLTTIGGAFALTDETGVGFATSRDPSIWQAVPTDRPPLDVLAAATGDKNQIVGIGTTNDASLALFRTIGSTTSTTPLAGLLGETASEVDAVVAVGPTRWVIYVFERDAEPGTRAWILSSADGLAWEALPTSAPNGNTPRLLPGDEQVLVQWVTTDGQLITLSVPLP